MSPKEEPFVFLNKLFWVVWCLVPFIIGMRVYFLFTVGYSNEGNNLTDELPIRDFSVAGQILACAFLSIGIFLYLLLLALMHALIRQFRHGGWFLQYTLTRMKWIATGMLAWPFMKLFLFNVLAYSLFMLGDIQEWGLKFGFDFALFASGLVIWALRLVVSHAIQLHDDAQYTV